MYYFTTDTYFSIALQINLCPFTFSCAMIIFVEIVVSIMNIVLFTIIAIEIAEGQPFKVHRPCVEVLILNKSPLLTA